MQQILKGYENIEKALSEVGSKRYMLVCDTSFPFLPIKDSFHPTAMFNDFTPNPLYEQVCAGVRLFNDNHCDAIVAVGGGSTIDVAKCIKLYCRMDHKENYLQQEYKDSGVSLIAIPTTAGTGSESTRYAVIYFEGKKQSVTHESIVPNYAVLEPALLKSLPLYQKKCTMLDAMCQAIESWWSVNSTEESMRLSAMALQTIVDNYEAYLSEKNAEAAWKIMQGANLAGQAINITQTTAPHAFSYKITSLYGLPHGHAVAVCMPEIWHYMLHHPEKCIDSRGIKHLDDVMEYIACAMRCENALDALIHFRAMLLNLGIDRPHSDARSVDIEILTHSVNPIRLKNNPVSLDEEAIRWIYNRIVE